jgi:hypothetical protein
MSYRVRVSPGSQVWCARPKTGWGRTTWAASKNACNSSAIYCSAPSFPIRQWSNASTSSEYRNFVDNNRLPIEQKTELRGTTITGSVKYALIPRGREVGSVAWVPNTIVPYVGAGGGAHWYRLRQQGDFVDFVDKHIFSDVFRSEGWAPVIQAFGGTDIQMYKKLLLTLEGRYSWSHADLSSDFLDFEPIDLGGFRFGAGIRLGF